VSPWSILSRVQLPRTFTPDTSRVDPRPNILLADNHAQFLEIVTRLLADDFNVVGAASDGRQAVDLSLRLDPDVAILDIGMPGLDGFQTLKELRRAGSRAKVIMLTMYESDAYVAAAINSGAQGYVLKNRIYSNLISAIDHAIAGRFFVPSLTSVPVGERGHAVQFHMKDRHFLDEVSRFVGGMLRSGELVVVAATEETRTGLAQRLVERGIDVAAIAAQGQYVVSDADESLAQFMRNGHPDPDLVAGIVSDLDRLRVSSRGPHSRLTLFGEMAVSLCRDGNIEAVVEVENIWSDLTRHLPFLTVCSYPGECFQHPKSRQFFPDVCAVHHAVSHTLHA
jgi:two-component system, NarL family, response regulator NreC